MERFIHGFKSEKRELQLRTIIYYEQEIKAGRVYLPEAECLLEDLLAHGIEVICVSGSAKDRPLREILAHEDAQRTEMLVLATTDLVLCQAAEEKIAVLAFENPDFLEEKRTESPILVTSFDGIDTMYVERIWRRAQGLPWQILETKRCVVRELTLDDMDELFALYQQKGMTEYMEPLYEREDELEYQKAYIANMYHFYGYGMWLVFEKESGRLIGRAGLENRLLHEEYELELGYAIGTDYQHQGYATEVCEAILEYAGEQLDYEYINCLIQKENTASTALAKRLGFLWKEQIAEQDVTYECYVRKL